MIQLYIDPSFTATTGITPGIIPGSDPVHYFNALFDTNVKDLIFHETSRFSEQETIAIQEHLDQHKHARGNKWRNSPMRREEVDPLLAILIIIGVVGYPTQR